MSVPDRRAARAATFTYFTINGFGVGLWVVHIPDVERAAGISHSVLGGLLFLLGGAAFAGMQVAGPLADRIGPRRLVPAAGVLNGVLLAAPGLAGSWWGLAVALIAFGFSNGALDVAMNSHAVVVERAYPRPIMAAFHAMWSIGGALAAAVGAVVLAADVRPWISLTAGGTLIAVTATLAGRFLWDAEPPGTAPAPLAPAVATSAMATSAMATPAMATPAVADPAVVAQAPSAPALADLPIDGGGRGVPGSTAAARRWLVWWLGGLAFALMLAEGVANDWAALHATDTFQAPASTAAVAYGAFAVAMTVGRFGADRVAAWLGPAAIVRYGAAMAASGLAVVALAPWFALAAIGWALFGLGLAGGVPQLFTAAGNLDPRSSGALMARVVGLGYVGLLAGPAVVGALAHWIPLHVAFVVPIVLCALAATGSSALAPAPAAVPAAGVRS